MYNSRCNRFLLFLLLLLPLFLVVMAWHRVHELELNVRMSQEPLGVNQLIDSASEMIPR